MAKKLQKKLGFKEAVSHSLNKIEFDFKNSRMRNLTMAFYAKNGELLYSSDTVRQWSNIIPESVGEIWMIKTYAYYKKYYQ